MYVVPVAGVRARPSSSGNAGWSKIILAEGFPETNNRPELITTSPVRNDPIQDRTLAGQPNFAKPSIEGRLAQLVEHLVYTERAGGSSPSPPTTAFRSSCISKLFSGEIVRVRQSLFSF